MGFHLDDGGGGGQELVWEGESEGADINVEQIESLVLNLADVGLGGGILEDLDEQIVLRQEVCDISLL